MAGIEKGPLFGGKGSRAVDNKNLHVAAVAVVNFKSCQDFLSYPKFSMLIFPKSKNAEVGRGLFILVALLLLALVKNFRRAI